MELKITTPVLTPSVIGYGLMALWRRLLRSVERGQVGIGTLIVFIAMVLVASIAGGVLLSTAGFLQSQSEETGEASSAQVSDRVTVMSKYGKVTEANNRLVLDSSQLDEYESGREEYREEIIVEFGTVFLFGGGATAGCSPPFHLVLDGVRSEEPFADSYADGPDYDQLKFEETSAGEIRVTHLDPDGEDYVITTSEPPISAKIVDEMDCNSDLLFEDPDGDSGMWWLVDETGTAEIRPARESLSQVSVTVQSAPGAGDVDLTDAVVTYTSATTVQQLTYAEGSASKTTFTTESLEDDDAILEDGEQVTLKLNTAELEPGLGLKPGAEVQLSINTRSSATTTTTITVPDTFSRAEPLL
ncbi:archaellin/type IV pilin N-terminal domain-containing protein [Halorientalis persicus]|uniref:archaellin/type IV pilin N-terminal domain-containing protein n=1 Tax=Halorientalis persicus TaxID=1367881 RepID=UPI00147BAE91